MKAMTGADILSVPYKSIPEATTDLIAGRIDMFFVGTNIALQHVQNGRLRALALTGRKRWKGLPEVPTMDEQGLKGFEKVNWFGLWLPAGAPPEIVEKIHAAVVAALAEPEVKAQFDQQGIEGIGMPPREFAAFVASEAKAAQDLAQRIHTGARK
jgi:tripartite-type tricarboxylate transporter receptor subunit TctC